MMSAKSYLMSIAFQTKPFMSFIQSLTASLKFFNRMLKRKHCNKLFKMELGIRKDMWTK